ncbi:MAG TPA: helix-turn-helix transcriptional regulator [Actinomycetota bacterium]
MSKSQAQQLGDRIKKARKAKGLSLRGLADAVGMGVSTIHLLEEGTVKEPRPAKLARIAEALELPMRELYDIVGYEVPGDLPELPVYLRSKYKLSQDEIGQLDEVFQRIAAGKKEGRRE